MDELRWGCRDVIDPALLAAMFGERKHVFVDLLGWDLPVLEGQYELDQFDGPSTQYIIIADMNGEHRGSMRLLPTQGPHLLGSIFPHLCVEPAPSSPLIWEISRFCLSRSLNAAERRIVRNQLITACVHFAQAHKIAGFSCVASLGWIRQILDFGWRCDPLGPPQSLASGWTGAMLIHIERDTADCLKKTGIWAPIVPAHSPQIGA